MNSSSKKFWQSKKCLAFLLLIVSTTGLVVVSMWTRQGGDVTREIVSTLGLAVAVASGALIGGQSFIDTRHGGKQEPAKAAPKPKKDVK